MQAHKDISAIIAFEDGTIFKGYANGATKTVMGEVVANTCMISYEEVLTDSAYSGKIVNMTTPEIGNYGICGEDSESSGAKLTALVVRELSPIASNWRSTKTIQEFLTEQNVPCISGVDTRAITRLVSEKGALKACLSTENISEEEAVKRAKEFKGIDSENLSEKVSTKKKYNFTIKDVKRLEIEGTDLHLKQSPAEKVKCALIDYGVKTSTLEDLAVCGFDITVYPSSAKASEILETKPATVILSSGPGNPNVLDSESEVVAEIIKTKTPVLGIGLGMNILAKALGVKSQKLTNAHSGGNYPVRNIEDDVVNITSQNCSYTLDSKELEKANLLISDINLNDNTVAGFKNADKSLMGISFYPSSSNGPKNSNSFFTNFYYYLKDRK